MRDRIASQRHLHQLHQHVFVPAIGFPVVIDYSDDTNPFSLANEVVYDNGIVHVQLEKGFKWDGASIPSGTLLIPWLATIVLLPLWHTVWAWALTALLLVYSIRLLPYLQKIGRHVRAMCVHDKLYRTQPVSRVVADAIAISIMENDGVPWDVRWIIYGRIRHFGWIAWKQNQKELAAKIAIAPRGETR